MKINHVLVLTRDIKKMTAFWTDVIGLNTGYRPPFPFAGEWLYSEEKTLIHVAQANDHLDKNGAIAHVALEGDNYNQLIATLHEHAIKYFEKDVPLSAERQVFVLGPDELTIEIIFPLSSVDEKSHPYADTGIKQIQINERTH